MFLFNLDLQIRQCKVVIGEIKVYITKHLGGGGEEIQDLHKGTITQGRDELILLRAGHEVCRPL